MALEAIALEWEKVLADTNQQLEVIRATEHQ